MKMLNALESLQRRGAAPRVLREGMSHPAARAVADHAAHLRTPCGASSVTATTSCPRPGRSPTRRAGAGRDRAVLQVNGKTARQHARRAQPPTKDAIEAAAIANERCRSSSRGQAVKKVVVVPGRLVNVVV